MNTDLRIVSCEIFSALSVPVIYGLVDDNDVVFYVGRTTNPSKRLKTYKSGLSHGNLALAERLKNNWRICILDENPRKLDLAEYHYIYTYLDTIVNVVGVSEFFNHQVKPWFGGTGIRCPSDYVMQRAAKNANAPVRDSFSQIYEIRESMSDTARCAFEISIYKDAHPFIRSALNKWFERCKDRILNCLAEG